MASRTFHPIRGSLDRELVFIHGSIVLDNAGAVSSFSGKGLADVVRNAAGDYTVTLVDSYPSFVHANVQIKAAYCDVIASMGAPDVLNKTIGITTGDLAAQKNTAVGCEILFQLVVSNTSVVY